MSSTESVPTTSEIVESLKVELQLNHLQGLWLEKKLERICASERLAELTAIRDIDGSTVEAWAWPAHQHILERMDTLQTLIEETPSE